MSNLREIAKSHIDQLKKIKIFLSDVDGILTNGQLFYSGEEMGYNRLFHTHDGYGFKMLQNAGLKTGIITGGHSLGVKKRFEDLGLNYIFMKNEDKREAYKNILDEGFKDEEILYIGDEFFDIPLLKRAGFSATCPEASLEIQESVTYVTKKSAGMGCVREVIDLVRYAQDITPNISDF